MNTEQNDPAQPRSLQRRGSALPASQTETTPYRPSNGSEGDWFEARWCVGCAKWRAGECGILFRAYANLIGEPRYPKEWVRTADGPTCTAYRAKGSAPDQRRGQRRKPGQGELFASPNGLKLSDAAGVRWSAWLGGRRGVWLILAPKGKLQSVRVVVGRV